MLAGTVSVAGGHGIGTVAQEAVVGRGGIGRDGAAGRIGATGEKADGSGTAGLGSGRRGTMRLRWG